MTSQYVHLAVQQLAVINERVSPMDKVKIKPLNRPYRKGSTIDSEMGSLQRELGRSSLTMACRYVHLASDQAAAQERVAAMDKLDVKARAPKAPQSQPQSPDL